MTSAELRILAVAAKYRKLYEDSNPDVGWGPSEKEIVRKVAAEAGMSITSAEVDDLAKDLKW